jgi:hypothetical protein
MRYAQRIAAYTYLIYADLTRGPCTFVRFASNRMLPHDLNRCQCFNTLSPHRLSRTDGPSQLMLSLLQLGKVHARAAGHRHAILEAIGQVASNSGDEGDSRYMMRNSQASVGSPKSPKSPSRYHHRPQSAPSERPRRPPSASRNVRMCRRCRLVAQLLQIARLTHRHKAVLDATPASVLYLLSAFVTPASTCMRPCELAVCVTHSCNHPNISTNSIRF